MIVDKRDRDEPGDRQARQPQPEGVSDQQPINKRDREKPRDRPNIVVC